jgi:hypothetical protein
MIQKNYDHTIRFRRVRSQGGNIATYPILEVTLICANGKRVNLPLLFDTGANYTTLIYTLYPLLGLNAWDVGQAVQTTTANRNITVYSYNANLELFGKIIHCPIHLSQGIQNNPIYMGLLGRHTVFNEFGFGFWESSQELYVTDNP